MILRSCFGFCLQIPANFYNRSQVCKHSCVYDVLYNKKSELHFEKFPFFYSLTEYYKYPELIMRGVYILKSDQKESRHWRYLQTEHLSDSNALATQLLKLGPQYPQFKELLYGKRDSFFHNVPLECLKKFYDHLSLAEFEAIIFKHCQVVTEEVFEQMTTRLGKLYSSQVVIDRSKSHRCYFIEDYFENKEFAQKVIPQLNKSEIVKTMQLALKLA